MRRKTPAPLTIGFMPDESFRDSQTYRELLAFFKEHTARQMAVEMALQGLGVTPEMFSGAVQKGREKVAEAKSFRDCSEILDRAIGSVLRDATPANDQPC